MAYKSRAEYENFFRQVDKDGNGQLTFDELIRALKAGGDRTPESDLRAFFRSVDTSGDGQLSMNEFLTAVGVIPAEKQDVFQQVFRSFDKDGNGYIDKNELQAVFAEMGKHMPESQVKRLMQLMDADGDGKVNYEEFMQQLF